MFIQTPKVKNNDYLSKYLHIPSQIRVVDVYPTNMSEKKWPNEQNIA